LATLEFIRIIFHHLLERRKELQSHIHRKKFEEVAKKEYQSLEARSTFKIVPKLPDIKANPLA